MCSPPKRRNATASVSKDYGPAVDCVRGRDGEHSRTGMLPLSAALLRSINILEERGGEGEREEREREERERQGGKAHIYTSLRIRGQGRLEADAKTAL